MAKPSAATSLVDVDYGYRLESVINTLTSVNAVLAYYYGNTTHNVSLPDQTSSARYIVGGGTMTWNTAVTALNAVITAAALSTTPLLLQGNIDNNDWQSQWNRLITFSNAILTALP